MQDMRFRDANGDRIAIDARVRLTDVQGVRLGEGASTRRSLLDLEGVVVGLDEIGDDGHPKGGKLIWVRIDGDDALVSVHAARVTLTKPSA